MLYFHPRICWNWTELILPLNSCLCFTVELPLLILAKKFHFNQLAVDKISLAHPVLRLLPHWNLLARMRLPPASFFTLTVIAFWWKFSQFELTMKVCFLLCMCVLFPIDFLYFARHRVKTFMLLLWRLNIISPRCYFEMFIHLPDIGERAAFLYRVFARCLCRCTSFVSTTEPHVFNRFPLSNRPVFNANKYLEINLTSSFAESLIKFIYRCLSIGFFG